MHINQFEICNTNNLEQLNGNIIIININDRVGYVVITVKENSDLEHSNLEKIKSEDGGKTWELTNPPHTRIGDKDQYWLFRFFGTNQGEKKSHTNYRYDSDMYKTYLYYHLSPNPINLPSPFTEKKIRQGNGTGTAGNTGGN